MKEKSFAMQAGILASAGLITKVIGFVYRIPMANIFSYPMIKFDMSLKQFQKPIS